MENIIVRGAATHNLKNINITIPRNKLVVITGLSGSGKSSLAFDTLYAEGQRRYVESLSSYARQFLSLMEKPIVEHIEGLSPAISIEQKSTSHNPRSTVGTITEIYDYLRLLYARIGEPRCPSHNIALTAQTVSQMVDTVIELPKTNRLMLLAPIVKNRKGEFIKTFELLASQGFIRARIDGEIHEIANPPILDLHKKHTIEVIVDRFRVNSQLKQRLAESFETTLELAKGTAIIASMDGQFDDIIFSANFACPHCGYSIDELEPRIFSFNNPAGACPTCDGLGVEQHIDPKKVIIDPKASIANGAIKGWDQRNVYYFHMMQSLAKHYNFSLETPFNKLDKKIRDIILYGSGNNKIQFNYTNDKGDQVQRKHSFEGIINNLNRRYLETQSRSVREDLAKYLTKQACTSCNASRLKLAARNVFIQDMPIFNLCEMSIFDTTIFFEQLKLSGQKEKIASKIILEIKTRLQFLSNVGLNYLSLNRSAETLSGGEAQRIRLASQIGAGLVGVMYVLDEPSIGLHQRDNERLLKTLTSLRDLGNSVLVVEHDEDAIKSADFIIDMGPKAGTHGGEIVACGSISDICKNEKSLTGQYLNKTRVIAIPTTRVSRDIKKSVKLFGACGNNLKNITLEIPLGLLTCITGVSGSGKSTLINDTFYKIAQQQLNNATTSTPAPYKKITGLEQLDKVINIDQSPIGRTPRSNPATYTGVFTAIREIFAATPESRARGYKPGRFSFNVKGGRCEACQGDGVIKVEMHFLADIYVPCDHCQGMRYNRETLDIEYKNKNIAQILEMTIEDAAQFFKNIPTIKRRLATLIDVGLGYITLGQSATTLSGGEAQRVKLSKELAKRSTGKTLYILDEPTTGLHFFDIEQLLKVLHRLRDQGNTLVVIEHNLDVIKTADWIIDLGPEGGDSGGFIVAKGVPEKFIKNTKSHTARFLKPILENN